MKPLDGLLQSYLDLQTHFDPAAASAAGIVSADARLGAFDAQSMREHLAAVRAIAAAIEDLELDDLDDEIDRTALLAEVRSRIARFEQERPHVRDPGFWLGHVHAAIASLLERTSREAVAPAVLARIAALPGLLDAARASIRRPPVLLVDAALLELGPLGELLVRAAADFGDTVPGGPDRLNAGVGAALEALARFGIALRDSIEPEADWARAALGRELFERRMQEGYALRSSAAELARWADHTLESGDPAAAVPSSEADKAGSSSDAAELRCGPGPSGQDPFIRRAPHAPIGRGCGGLASLRIGRGTRDRLRVAPTAQARCGPAGGGCRPSCPRHGSGCGGRAADPARQDDGGRGGARGALDRHLASERRGRGGWIPRDRAPAASVQ
ncbi:MAG TPA: DUF885 family protein [Gemmatimonadales bacterium]|nr:DUF885 family protein [Gemmatimonadales bacterium]